MAVPALLLLSIPALLVSAYEVQEDDVTFYLYTRNQWELQITLKNLNAIDATKELRFLVHGWNATHNVMWVNELTVVSLQAKDLDIICVDWSPLASQSAFVALAHADQAAYFVANFIKHLVKNGVALENVELIGHSMGAHIAGYTGKYVRKELSGRRVGRLVMLDPGNLVTENTEGWQKDDADVVLVVHTTGGSMGVKEGLGSVDFYANGGLTPQPGCIADSLECSHFIVTDFLIESIENPIAFLSIKCESYEKYLSGDCDTNDTVPLGANLKGKEGNYFFETNPVKPFSLN